MKLGCRAVHIGGGEPGLDMERLGDVLDAAHETGMHIDYVETNAFWFVDEDRGGERLRFLKSKGLGAFLVSISPFHNTFVPYGRVVNLMRTAREEGVGVIPWVTIFNTLLSKLDQSRPHSWDELEKALDADLLDFVLRNYWIHPGGRALELIRHSGRGKSVEAILDQDRYGCETALCDTSHFHVDYHGVYIPGLCSGLSIDMNDLDAPLESSSYPIICTLMTKGINGLYEMAISEYGYGPIRETYAGKCDLCNDIRSFLVKSGYRDSMELAPVGYYSESQEP